VAPEFSEAAATSYAQHVTSWFQSERKEQRCSTEHAW